MYVKLRQAPNPRLDAEVSSEATAARRCATSLYPANPSPVPMKNALALRRHQQTLAGLPQWLKKPSLSEVLSSTWPHVPSLS